MAEYYEHIYPYQPSLALALSAAGFFGILAFLHTYQALRSNAWFFIAFVIGGYFDCFGYLIRAFPIQQRPKYTLPPYAESLVLIPVAPALFAASIYMFLDRIIRLIQAEYHAVIRVGWLAKIFILGDVVSFAAQGIGAVMLKRGDVESTDTRGVHQGQESHHNRLGRADRVLRAVPLYGAMVPHPDQPPSYRPQSPQIPWKSHLQVLYAVSLIILVRCIYRFVEYRMAKPGEHGYLLAHEWPAYAFDMLLMLAVMILFFAEHPSEVAALRQSDGGIAMKYLSGRHIGPVDDRWRTLPEPELGPRMYYEAGSPVMKMTRYPRMAA